MIDIECRHFPRFPIHSKGVIVFPTFYRDVTLCDISMHGALVESLYGRGFPLGAKCTLRVLSADDRQAFETDVTVARAMNGIYFGLVFGDMHAGAKRALYHLIETSMSGDDAFAKRDLCVLFKTSSPARPARSDSASGTSSVM